MELTPEEREVWDEFVEAFRRDAVEKIAGSAAFISIFNPDDWDVKFAAELGTAIMMDKPILIVAPEGTEITGKLETVADQIVYADVDTEEGRVLLKAAMALFARVHGLPGSDGE